LHEGLSVVDLIFQFFIADVLQLFQHQHLEQQQDIRGFSSGLAFARFLMNLYQNGTKRFPRHQLIQLIQDRLLSLQFLLAVFDIPKSLLSHSLPVETI
jgi:glutathione synthase/RimK-type ligase-like ATP-grasp enzyme